MDANEDARSGEVNLKLILDLHSNQSPPATHNWNTQQQPIDSMWGAGGVTPSTGGHLAFGAASTSEHQGLHLNSSYSVAFGHASAGAMTPLQPKRLKAKDLRPTKNHFKRVKKKMVSSGFKQRFDKFKWNAQLEWNNDLKGQFNRPNKENAAIRQSVESKLRKLCMGGCEWSPAIALLRNAIELCCMRVKRKTWFKTSTLMRRLLRKVPQAHNAFSCSLSEAVCNPNQAFEELKPVSKQETILMCHESLGTLAEALAIKKGALVETEAKQLQTIEATMLNA
jgi:hypothetical protein